MLPRRGKKGSKNGRCVDPMSAARMRVWTAADSFHILPSTLRFTRGGSSHTEARGNGRGMMGWC